MTETHTVSIEEVRTLVAERQRYEDWLTALEAKRAETPVRVFERVKNDYVARRQDVMNRLHEHVGGLTSMANDFDARLHSLDSQLGTLEDERAEAMLRTSVGEFDSDRWERVKQEVESQIGQLGNQRTGLISEIDEVRTLLASARSEPEVPAATAQPEAPVVEQAAPVAAAASDGVVDILADVDASGVAVAPEATDDGLIDVVGTEDAFGAVTPFAAAQQIERMADEGTAPTEELSELDNALSLFGGASKGAPTAPTAGSSASSLNDLDVFDDAELGDLRMAPPARSTATVTPPASPSAPQASAAAPSRDGFDDLAFLRSVVDPSAAAAAGAAPAASGDQQKTLRCTECGTMNFPSEWYCERCGGELAAF
jgi:hypothetical protein